MEYFGICEIKSKENFFYPLSLCSQKRIKSAKLNKERNFYDFSTIPVIIIRDVWAHALQ